MNDYTYDLADEIASYLREYLKTYNRYKPTVSTLPKGSTFPKVVFECIDNRSSGRTSCLLETHSSVTYEIDIFAKEKNGISERTIARDIANDIDHVMSRILGLKRILKKPTPDIDVSIYRITLRYTGIINDQRNCFI